MMDERSACTNFNETWSGRFFVREYKHKKLMIPAKCVSTGQHSTKQPKKNSVSYLYTLYKI